MTSGDDKVKYVLDAKRTDNYAWTIFVLHENPDYFKVMCEGRFPGTSYFRKLKDARKCIEEFEKKQEEWDQYFPKEKVSSIPVHPIPAIFKPKEETACRVLELIERGGHFSEDKTIREVKFACDNPLQGGSPNTCTVDQWNREIQQ